MALSSMTGFARGQGVSGAYAWSWELKSVNGKGLDVRLRVPTGWDAIEGPARSRVTGALTRGTVYGTLTVKREGVTPVVRINEPVLAAMLTAAQSVASRINAAPPTVDGILALRGVVDVVDDVESESERRAAEAAITEGFERTLSDLAVMRLREGDTLARVLEQRLAEIETLVQRADAVPGRRPDAIRARIAEQIAVLMDASERLDRDRLHQEAVLIAAKADIREELDRLSSHVDQTRQMIADGGAVGRRLDFLAQEFNREANTVCSKSNDIELTAIGVALKTVVDQFREQVQNLE